MSYQYIYIACRFFCVSQGFKSWSRSLHCLVLGFLGYFIYMYLRDFWSSDCPCGPSLVWVTDFHLIEFRGQSSFSIFASILAYRSLLIFIYPMGGPPTRSTSCQGFRSCYVVKLKSSTSAWAFTRRFSEIFSYFQSFPPLVPLSLWLAARESLTLLRPQDRHHYDRLVAGYWSIPLTTIGATIVATGNGFVCMYSTAMAVITVVDTQHLVAISPLFRTFSSQNLPITTAITFTSMPFVYRDQQEPPLSRCQHFMAKGTAHPVRLVCPYSLSPGSVCVHQPVSCSPISVRLFACVHQSRPV